MTNFFKNPVRLLAPMEGLTDPVMRDVLTQIAVDLNANNGKGYDWSVSEFIRVTNHVLPEHVFYKYIPELHTNSKAQAGTPIHAQLLGSNPQLMAENACKVAEMGSPAVDLNFGCPAKTVNNHRGGSVLLDEPNVIQEIISAVRLALPSNIPVSAKIRLGYNDTQTKSKAINRPPIGKKSQNLLNYPFQLLPMGKFGMNCTLHAKQCVEQSQTQHLMLGRGAVTRPDLIAQVDNPQIQLTWQQLLPYQINFLQGEFRSEKAIVGRYKQWLGMLQRGYQEAQLIWHEVKREQDRLKIIEMLKKSF